MTNWTELKRLAEEATPGPWEATDYRTDDGESAWWFVDTTAKKADIFDDSGDPHPNHWDSLRGERDMKFIATANPKTILALIAENERLNEELSACTESPGGCGYWREAARHRESERDQLRAEVEALRRDADLLDKLENTVKIGSRSVPPHDDDSWQGIYAFRTKLQGRNIREALWSAVENEPAYIEYIRELNAK